MADAEMENWDDDADFAGDFHTFAGNSVGTVHTSISSRMSVHSESIAGDDDWNVVLQPNDEQSTTQAIQSAKHAGIPLPNNIPSSALLGGTIKRLGKKKSRQKVADDWDNDLDMPDNGAVLQLKPAKAPEPHEEEFDDFDELEGSLGTRFAGTKRGEAGRNRSSSASAMSPSLGSATAESEEDELRGLELPEGPMDFDAILKKRRAADAELSDLSQPSLAIEQPSTVNAHKKSKLLADDNDDFLNDFDLGGGDILDNSKTRTMNKNLKVKTPKQAPLPSAQRPSTTLNFHDKPTDKPVHMRSHLPRPVSGSKPSSRLEPVFETGASQITRERRQPTTTGAQYLRSKRSMPALRSQQPSSVPVPKPPVPFLPAGVANHTSQHAAAQRAMPYHLRRDSDPNRNGAQSPPPRSQSRLSNAYIPDTPSRANRTLPRKDVAPAALAREAAAKRTVTKPARRRNFGDGSELDIFDDLPTSTTKESKFVKEPVARGPPRPLLRHAHSRSEIRDPSKPRIGTISGIPDRMTTPAPPRTPASPTKGFYEPSQNNTPSYLRDTAASRIARESRLAKPARPRSEGPLMPLTTNWKAQVAARSPFTSPSAQRQKPTKERKQPTLIKNMGVGLAKTQNGMTYNPHTLRWEGNENTLAHFEIPPPLQTPTPTGHQQPTSYMDRQPHHQHHHAPPSASPPRPALIAPMSAAATQGVQVNGGMVFDPRQMKWLKLKESNRQVSGPLSPSVTDADEEEDAFAGIDDLQDENAPGAQNGGKLGGSVVGGMASPVSMAGGAAGPVVHEEFDLGPNFIKLQREEEAVWRRRCEGWFVNGEEAREELDEGWRWAIRRIVPPDEEVL